MPYVTLTVRVTYEGSKASNSLSKSIKAATAAIRKDLASFKLPMPLPDSVSVVRRGTIEFIWCFQKGSSLDENVTETVRFPGPKLRESFRKAQIESMELQSRYTSLPSEIERATANEKKKQREDSGGERLYRHKQWVRPGYQEEKTADAGGDLQEQAKEFLDDIEKVMSDKSPPVVNASPKRPSEPSYSPSKASGTLLVEPTETKFRYCDRPDNAAECLLSELADVQKQIAQDLASERNILDQLKSLESIPSGMTSSGSEFVIKTRLKLAEDQLEDERRRRKAAEDAISDIKRECREPFIVPGLLDAFTMLSDLSTKVGV
ncbi:hypothetical protein PM082_022899 [Marasmius tenuissimus]|nr:hypothetical protein PM082_022899 [Marasmius tenuissimus]